MKIIGVSTRGATAGIVGGAVLAVWFLFVDGFSGQAFRTPALLAASLLGNGEVVMSGGRIALYSAIHFGIFALVGALVGWIVSKATSISPNVLWGLLLGLVLFAVTFYTSLTVTGTDVLTAPGWWAVFVGDLLAGVSIMGFLSLYGREGPFPLVLHGLDGHDIIREGILIGLVGAVVVAFWLLVVDLAQARPFFTPAALGSALFLGVTDIAEVRIDWVVVFAYTVVHVAAFLAAGMVGAAIVWEGEKTPFVLLAGVLLFVAFEAFFVGFTALVAEFLLGALAWWSIAIGNLLAAGSMGYVLMRRHPGLHAPDWEEDGELRIPDYGGDAGQSEAPQY